MNEPKERNDRDPDWADEIDKFLTGTVNFLLRFGRTCWIMLCCPWRARRHIGKRTAFVRPYPYLFISALLISGAAVLSLSGDWTSPDRVVTLAYDAADYFDATAMALAIVLAVAQVVIALLAGSIVSAFGIGLSREDAVRWVSYALGTQWLTLGVFFLLRRMVGPAMVLVEDVIQGYVFIQPAWTLWWALPSAGLTSAGVRNRVLMTLVGGALTLATIGGNAVPQLVDSLKQPLRLSVSGYRVQSEGTEHNIQMSVAITNTSGRPVFMEYQAWLSTWPDLGLTLPVAWEIPEDAPPELVLAPGDTYHMKNVEIKVHGRGLGDALSRLSYVAIVFQNRSHGAVSQWAKPEWRTPQDAERLARSLGGRRISQ
jgi:hypothetical protein